MQRPSFFPVDPNTPILLALIGKEVTIVARYSNDLDRRTEVEERHARHRAGNLTVGNGSRNNEDPPPC